MARWSRILSVLIGCGGDDEGGGTAPGEFPRACCSGQGGTWQAL